MCSLYGLLVNTKNEFHEFKAAHNSSLPMKRTRLNGGDGISPLSAYLVCAVIFFQYVTPRAVDNLVSFHHPLVFLRRFFSPHSTRRGQWTSSAKPLSNQMFSQTRGILFTFGGSILAPSLIWPMSSSLSSFIKLFCVCSWTRAHKTHPKGVGNGKILLRNEEFFPIYSMPDGNSMLWELETSAIFHQTHE
jgi:hypothetical protein